MKNGLLGFIVLAALTASASAANRLTSPDGQIEVEISTSPRLEYAVKFAGKPLLESSRLGLTLKDGPTLGEKLAVVEAKMAAVNQTWECRWGKASHVVDRYNELRLALVEGSGQKRKIDVIFRAYDDGVAFRYALPRQPGLEQFILTRDESQFRFPGNPTVWAADYGGFVSHQEGEFTKRKMADIQSGAHVGLPLLVQVASDAYAAITEADLTDWAGMYLHGDKTPAVDKRPSHAVAATLSPRRDNAGLIKAATPHNSPWRAIFIGRRPGDLIESNLVLNLSPPCEIQDTSWIKPGKMAWDHWWSGEVKMDMATNRQYITFAGEMGFPYQLVDWQWYGPFDQVKSDITRSAPQMNIPELVKFAAKRNVRLWLWLYWTDAARKMEEAFPLYEKWGIAGVKIDFMQRDDQEMVDWYEKAVRLAAKHHLMVDFHGAYKPTGLRRTLPNLLTREGVMGNEYNKFSNRVTPQHTATLPFTRMLAGPMDFTPGGFLNRQPSKFRQGVPTFVMGTRAHELAEFVVFESPLTCVCDDPSHYHQQPGLQFLKDVPSVWDETRVLAGEVGQYIVMARRSGAQWYLGAMNDSKARTLDVSLKFLETPAGAGRGYRAEIYTDTAASANDAEKINETRRNVTAAERLTIPMVSAGGMAVRFVRQP
jgi:alpha-glucosidase